MDYVILFVEVIFLNLVLLFWILILNIANLIYKYKQGSLYRGVPLSMCGTYHSDRGLICELPYTERYTLHDPILPDTRFVLVDNGWNSIVIDRYDRYRLVPVCNDRISTVTDQGLRLPSFKWSFWLFGP